MKRPDASLADIAVQALLDELKLFPKPGLVSPVDSGSHKDMDFELLRASALSLHPAFEELAQAGAEGAAFRSGLIPIGLRAEQRMLEVTGGVNTHRGAIFAMGLLVAATAAAGKNPSDSAIRETLLSRWGGELRSHSLGSTHPPARPPEAGGAREEAALGFPGIFEVALPHFRNLLGSGVSEEDSALETLFLLIASIQDTNLLHRGGEAGSRFARQCARAWLDAGGIAHPEGRNCAIEIHREFVVRNLSPGGAADLLAGTLFLHRVTA
jgi:triphosphoribosyl-dephospho-CoA synthase